MDERKGTAVEALLEQLIASGPNDIAGVFARAFELAMELERERFLRADSTSALPSARATPTATSPSGSTRPPAA
jgi:putative transposase